MNRTGALILLVALNSGCISIATHEAQMRKCRETADEARRMEKDLAKQKTRTNELESMVAEQQVERDALHMELTQVRGTYDELIQELKDDIERGEVAVRQTSDGLIITLDNQILFQSGQAELQKPGRRVLVQVAEVLRHVQNHSIQVQGHTDNVKIGGLKSRYPSNWDLSAARAASVLRFLMESGKIDPASLILEAYADQKPVGDNTTSEGRRQNRRVDIVLVPKK